MPVYRENGIALSKDGSKVPEPLSKSLDAITLPSRDWTIDSRRCSLFEINGNAWQSLNKTGTLSSCRITHCQLPVLLLLWGGHVGPSVLTLFIARYALSDCVLDSHTLNQFWFHQQNLDGNEFDVAVVDGTTMIALCKHKLHVCRGRLNARYSSRSVHISAWWCLSAYSTFLNFLNQNNMAVLEWLAISPDHIGHCLSRVP